MSFKDNLRKARERYFSTAKDFADSLGIPPTTYSNYENRGQEPKYETLCRIADALHVSAETPAGTAYYVGETPLSDDSAMLTPLEIIAKAVSQNPYKNNIPPRSPSDKSAITYGYFTADDLTRAVDKAWGVRNYMTRYLLRLEIEKALGILGYEVKPPKKPGASQQDTDAPKANTTSEEGKPKRKRKNDNGAGK